MERTSKRAWLMMCVLVMGACSGTPQTMLSPTAAPPTSTSLNPDGSNMKVGRPSDLGPNGVVVSTLRPTLTWTNPAGRFATVGLTYDVEIQNANGAIVYTRSALGETPGAGSHTLQDDLSFSDNFWFRVRARLGNDLGPWSDFAQFRTFDRPAPPPPAPTPTPTPGTGGLPFAIPGSCLAGNGAQCAFDVSLVSAEWARCRGGSGVGCHRFTRQVVFALSQTDPNWQMIQAAPGGHACDCFTCGPSNGAMFREDTTVYRGTVFDMIVGAGGPAPSISWFAVGGVRPGDVPGSAPVCQP
jgi:hypothetical protein